MAGHRVWFDVEDLFAYSGRRPSGIQRLAFEVYRAAWARGGAAQVGFVRHHPSGRGFLPVDWSELDARYGRLIAEAPPAAPAAPARQGRGRVLKALQRLPERARKPALETLAGQVAVFQAAARLFGALAPPPHAARPAPDHPPEMRFERGDVLAAFGAPWSAPGYADLIERQKTLDGVRFALLIYDIIPVRRPEWFDRDLTRAFRDCLFGLLPLADQVFAISKATAVDVHDFAHRERIGLARPVRVLPIGHGFGDGPAAPAGPRPEGLPTPGRYALMVSTIEVRKNHAILFRAWRRLLEEMPRTATPTLVFAGRVGWLVGDLMTQLANAGWLGGKIVLVEDPSDEVLAHLYDGCLFTLFPSQYEGWGLPVTESLAFGKPALISDRTALPEAGGDLARYFDPDDLHQVVRAIREVIEDPVGRIAWERRIRDTYRPRSWDETAEALLRTLDAAPADAAQPALRSAG
jgi:glycosyltransferase involved in cell wall biosynthesis